MSTGSTLHLLSYTNEPISEDLYKIYLEKVKEYNCDELFSKKNDDTTVSCPMYFFMKDPDLTVLNLNRSLNRDSIHLAKQFSTTFNSVHTILTDHWNMNPYNIDHNEHLITDAECFQILQVCEYINSDLIYHKDAVKFENAFLNFNPFFEPFIKELPSREYPKEFSKGDQELKELEGCTKWFCKEFATFLRFYKSVSSDSWYTKENYALIYTKW